MIDLIKKLNLNRLSNQEFSERLNLVQEIPVFEKLSKNQLLDFIRAMTPISYRSGKKLLIEGEAVGGVYFIKEGEVQILVTNSQSGKEELITHGYAGECFGEMSTLRTNENASATVLTASDTTVLFIHRKDFIHLVNRYNLWPIFTEVMADRLEKSNHRMTEIMKHVKQGMVEVDRHGKITSKFSMGFVQLVGCKVNEIHKQSLSKMLFKDCKKSKQLWRDNLEEVFSTSLSQISLSLGLLPTECQYYHPQKGLRIYQLSYDICIYQGEANGLDIGIEDVTFIREMGLKNKEWENEKRIVQEIYTNSETFRSLLGLIGEVNMNLKELRQQILSKQVSQDDLRYWLGNIHSLKGTSRFLQLDDIGDAAHKMENIVIDIRSDHQNPALYYDKYIDQANTLENKTIYVNSIMEKMSDETRRRLTAELILTKQEVISLQRELKGNKAASGILMNAQRISSNKLVEGWDLELKRICAATSKHIQFKIIGEHVSIPGNIHFGLKLSILHLLRNCAAHGIEPYQERNILKKRQTGLISFQVQLIDNYYVITIQDDGAGVNKKMIVDTAKKIAQKDFELKTKIEYLLQREKVMSILFLPGFSTSKIVSDLSGRGVGLDVVQRAIKKINGNIMVQTVVNAGTKFIIKIPTKN